MHFQLTAIQPSASVPAWRVAVIGVVGALAVGIGIALGGFLLANRASPLGSGASYVPSSAPIYFELRLEPTEAQDASLRELLGRFPAIEGVDLDRPLYEQLTEVLDEAQFDTDSISWSEDIDSWFDGSIGFAMLDIPTELMTMTDPMAVPAVPSMVALLGVDDPVEAEAAIGRLRSEAGAGVTFTEQVHAGVSIQVAEGGVAYALTDDQLIVAPIADDIVAAIDAHASSNTTLAEAESISRLTDALPSDWLMFAMYDLTDVMAAAFEGAAAASPGADALGELMAHQSFRGAMAVTVGGDRVAIETASDPPTGPLAVVNADRGLADEVPADVLYYAEGGNVGAGLTALIGPLKETLAAVPEGEQQLDMIESALGGDMEELVAWMGDAATVVGFDGEQLWGGVIIVPTDADAAGDTMDKLATFATLASLDPSLGISLEERELEGVTVTSLRWSDPNARTELMPGALPMVPTDVVVEWVVTDDRVLIGVGDRFVERVHGQEAAGSLAEAPRYRDAVAELGGATNAGVTWIDLHAVIATAETAFAGQDPTMAAEISDMLDWLRPLDRVVGVSRLDGEVLVSSLVLLVE